eukprot:TRINITY_DN1634_c0_g1_i4.p1 TRINITY_DN1634_c0_g1~~TRINITY_DN1634_c0_g1_i4.p1  ORF type:complete len:183 (+),score=106.95 TRINITY_DN1634_c0_g1_i4:53-601(+)
MFVFFFFFQAEDGIRDLVRSRGLGDVYKRQAVKKDIVNLFKNKKKELMLLRLHQANKKIHRLEDNDQITLNDRYRKVASAKLDLTEYNVRINENDLQDIVTKVLKERQDVIDACIVRTMKRESKQNHQQLVGKVIRELQSKFPCPPEAITRRIETLSNGTHADGILLKKVSEDEYEYQLAGQ